MAKSQIKVPEYYGFPHNLGVEERASLMLYGQLVVNDPSAATYESVAVARGKAYSTVKNQLDSARRKMGTNTTWGAYLLMVSREKVQARKEDRKWQQMISREKRGPRSSRLAKTGKSATRRQSERVPAAS